MKLKLLSLFALQHYEVHILHVWQQDYKLEIQHEKVFSDALSIENEDHAHSFHNNHVD